MMMVVVGVGGCSTDAPEIHSVKQEAVESAPILGIVEEGYWVDFDTGADGRVPGPSDRGENGVVKLAPERIADLMNGYDWLPAKVGDGNPVDPALADKFRTDGQWVRSADFNDEASKAGSGAGASFYFNKDANLVAFTAVE